MEAENPKSDEKKPGPAGRTWEDLRAGRLNDALARLFLGALAIATVALAAGEDHEAIGSALVGAAIAFGLGAAFLDRVEELGPRGARIREKLEKLGQAAERELSDVDPRSARR